MLGDRATSMTALRPRGRSEARPFGFRGRRRAISQTDNRAWHTNKLEDPFA